MAKANNPPDTEETNDIAEQSDNKDKKKKEKKERIKGEGGSGAKIFIIVFILAVVGLAVAIIGFNAFNIRDQYLADTLRNLPIVGNLIPPPELAEGEEAPPPPEPEVSTEDLEAQIARLERENAAQLRTIDSLENTIEQNRAEMERLRRIESQQEAAAADKRAFDEMIINGNPGAFAEFYERVAPETAEELYPSARANADRQAEIEGYLSAIGAMDERAAARMLEELVMTDLDLVVEILKGMTNRRAGEILSSMTPANASTVTKRWDPINY